MTTGKLPYDCDWIIDDQLCATSWPTEGRLRALRDLGFTKVISVANEDTSTVRDACQALGMTWLRYPVADMTAPDLGHVRDFVAEVDAELEHGGKIVVHCLGGIGRTGTMMACYLVAHGWRPADAIAEVRRRRYGSIQTSAQERCVFRFANELHGPPGASGTE